MREVENLPRLPNDLEHKVWRGVRARLVRNELLKLSKPQPHDLFHEALELNFTIQRPHEMMVVLVIRPFHESQLDVPLARLGRLSFGSVLPFTLRRSVGERWARGVAFVGLRKRRDIYLTSLLRTLGIPMVAGMLTLVAILNGAPIWWIAAGAIGTWALVRAIRGWAQDRKVQIRNRDDLARVLDQVRRRAISPLTFFRASEDMWRETIQELAKLASLIFADVGRRAEGLEWELAELGRTSREKFVMWAINPDYNWGAGKLARSPDDEHIEVLITAFGQPIIDRISSHLGQLRHKYDACVAREVLTRALSEEPWVDTFWEGISATTEQRFDIAKSLFSSAWQTARTSASSHAMYPGIALLDTMAMIDGPSDRIEQLVEDLTQLLVELRPSRGNQTNGTRGQSPKFDSQLHQDARIEGSVRALFYEFDSRQDVPLALWQFRAILGGGIRRLVGRGLARRFDEAFRNIETKGR